MTDYIVCPECDNITEIDREYPEHVCKVCGEIFHQ